MRVIEIRPRRYRPAMWLGLLVHLHTLGGAAELPYPESESRAQCLANLIADGLIQYDPHVPGAYCTTARGSAHVLGLLDAELPFEKWVSPVSGETP